ncbi:hypothetical protein JKF63_04674 [Porcisia hertigi]|uniref:Uncharacterized protein n=1 Tax=Porcisia hertigi TaxID=2761500 RepID=A0A836ITP5_9TRYP|nr:hypothetical protein JKF63_04674 [Porcisia hertigi]
MPSSYYTARIPPRVVRTPRPPDPATRTAHTKAIGELLSPTAATAAVPHSTAPETSVAYYVVGCAVLNPQLTVSPSVQEEVREVPSLNVVPDMLLRPGFGPQLNNIHGVPTPAAAVNGEAQRLGVSPDRARVPGGAWSSSNGGASRRSHSHTTSPTCAVPSSLVRAAADDAVVAVEAIRTCHPRNENVPLLQQTLDASRASSLGLLRRLYQTTTEDVIEVARTNLRNGALEPPRLQYHLAKELLPELTDAEEQLKTLASARRHIDWDVNIPTADTLPPPVIAFTTARDGAPVATLHAVRFKVDTSTLVMQRDYTSEPAVASAGVHPRTVKSAPTQDDDGVGYKITREDRIGSSGLYCVHRLVGLLPGLGEQVGLERVLEYKVVTSANELFIMPPFINSCTGDLFMELNTSRQGTVKLSITGVDCGSVEPVTGALQKSSNTLTCFLVFQHSSNASASGATRDHALKTMGAGSTYHAQVPSVAARLERAITAGTVAGGVASVCHRSGAETQGTDGFALSLAHFDQETGGSTPAATSRTGAGRLNCAPSLTRDGLATGAPDAVALRGKQTPVSQPRRNNLGVQRTAPRNSAASGVAAVSSPERPTCTDSEAAGTVSAAYGPATYKTMIATASAADHGPYAADNVGGTKADSRHRPQHYLFPATNPHELRYDCYREATRLRRLQLLKHQQEIAMAEGQRVAEQQPKQQQAAQTSAAGSNDNAEREVSETEAADSDHRKLPVTSSDSRARMRCNPKVEVLNIEEERDIHSTPNNGGHPETTLEKNGNVLDADATTNRELRSSPLPTTFFFMDSLQSPLSYMRLTGWQDRLITLFREEDMDLLHRETRTCFKREAFQELSDGALAGMFANLYLCSGGVGISSAGANKRTSMHARRGSTTAALRSFGGGSDGIFAHANTNINNPFAVLASRNSATANGSNAGVGGVQLTASAEVAADKTFTMLRRLILCLALEEERASTQLYNDTVQLCGQLCHSALLKTTALTRGTRDGLQQAAAAVLSSSSSISPRIFKTSGVQPDFDAALPVKDLELLRSLNDALELSMTTMMIIGAYGEAVEYALQRVHTLCLLEGDTGTLVNAAQRDLTEAYLFYGDYATAATVAEDVVMLTRQLYQASSDADEVVEAEMLCTLACVAAGRLERLPHYIDNLEINILPLPNGSYRMAHATHSLLQAKLRLVLVLAKTYLVRSGSTGEVLLATPAAKTTSGSVQKQDRAVNNAATFGTSDAVTLLREAVRLLHSIGNGQEMEQNPRLTGLPSQVRQLKASFGSGTFTEPMRVFGNLNAMSGEGGGNSEDSGDIGAHMEAAEKRLQWNLLSFAGVQLLQNDQVQEGIAVMEHTVKELVLNQKRHGERNQCAALAAVLWVGLMLAKSRMQPEQAADIIPMLKEMSNRVVRTRGPLHPLAAMANLRYAYISHYVTNSRNSVNLATRSVAALELGVGPKSYDRLTAHYVVGSMAQAQKRWRPAIDHLSAAYAIAQTTHLADDDMLLMDTQFLGALLLCPPTAVLDLDTTTFRAHLEERLQRLRERVGPHSDKLVVPLWNTAELLYMLKDTNSAIKCLQQAVRLLDLRGALLVSTDLLKPVDVLMLEQYEALSSVTRTESIGGWNGDSGTAQAADACERGELLVRQRNALVHASFDTVSQTLDLATTLFMWAAMLESQANTTEAQEMYNQSLALYETVYLGDNSLAALHIIEALSKLLYTAGTCGDALMWARKAEKLLHYYYRKEWPLEHAAVRKIVDAVEHRLFIEEGTYIVQTRLPTHSDVVGLL